MDKQIKENIIKRLHEIEREHNICILYAVESGSRAWGFESKDSDYDIRFIYKHELKWYLNIVKKRDVIEYPITDIFDYSGWDLRKTLFLLNKSNPVLFEWLQSPIVYIKDDTFYTTLSKAAELYFSPISSIYHYLHMASGNYRQYLKSDLVKVKKYFYVLRPLMACMWIERYNNSPPMKFEDLLLAVEISNDLNNTIRSLLERKKKGNELEMEPQISILNEFIEDKIEYYTGHTNEFDPAHRPGPDYLDSIFYDLLI